MRDLRETRVGPGTLYGDNTHYTTLCYALLRFTTLCCAETGRLFYALLRFTTLYYAFLLVLHLLLLLLLLILLNVLRCEILLRFYYA